MIHAGRPVQLFASKCGSPAMDSSPMRNNKVSFVFNRYLVSLALAFSALFLLAPHGYADPLSDVMESPAYKRIDRPTRGKNGLYSAKWLTPGSSFYSIFSNPKGAALLLDWLGVGSLGLTLGAVESHRYPEYVVASRALLTEDLGRIEISARVPHPKFKDTIEVGLVTAFVALEPPQLKILYSKPVQIGEVAAMYYEHEDGACSLVIKGDRGSLVNIQTPSLKHAEVLSEIAAKLDIARFNERLTS